MKIGELLRLAGGETPIKHGLKEGYYQSDYELRVAQARREAAEKAYYNYDPRNDDLARSRNGILSGFSCIFYGGLILGSGILLQYGAKGLFGSEIPLCYGSSFGLLATGVISIFRHQAGGGLHNHIVNIFMSTRNSVEQDQIQNQSNGSFWRY